MGLVADVFKFMAIDENGNVVASATLQDANIEITANTSDVRGGQGNGLIAILHSERDINIPITDVKWDYKYLAMFLGQTIKTAAGVAYSFPEWYEASEEDEVVSITLNETPAAGETLSYTDEDGKTVTGVANGKTVTFAKGVKSGDNVLVNSYKYATNANTESVDFDSNVFAKDFTVVLETIELDDDTEPTHRLQYIFDRSKPVGSFNLNTTSERNASTQQMSFRVLKPRASTKVGRALRIPITTN